MPDFSYEALANTGIRSKGTLSAGNEREALALLDARGLFPVRIDMTKGSISKASGSKKVKPRVMAVFYSQLADLLHSGVPLLRSLDLLQRQDASPNLAAILREMSAKVADGTTLADAMGEHPKAFTELAVSMVRAGQEGGFLEDALKRIANFTEHQEELKSKVVGALVYPLFLMITGVLVLNALMIFVVPNFKPLFDEMEKKGSLPQLTIMLIAVSEFMQKRWWVILIVVVGSFVLFRRWANSPSGRIRMDAIKLRLPKIGTIYLNLALSRFTRILGTLLHNGIPILLALRIGKDSTGNKILSKAIDEAADNVTGGKSLAEPLAASKHFPKDIVEMVAIGEESNNLEQVLMNVSDSLERRTTRQLDMFVRLLEPIMLLVMAGITLVVVAGLLLPIFKMGTVMQQQ